MIDLGAVADLRPEAAPLDRALKARLRAELFGDVAAEDIPVGHLMEIRSARQPGRRLWKFVVAGVAASLLLAALAVNVWRPTNTPQAGTSTTTPSSSTALSTNGPTSPSTRVDRLPPEIEVPDVVPVLDPNPFDEPPLREDPLDTWLMHATDQTRWFVNTDPSGNPVNGIRVELWAASEWDKSFTSADEVDLNGMHARTLGSPVWVVAWQVDGGVLALQAVDVDEATLLEVARVSASASETSAVIAPSGWADIPVPARLGAVDYGERGARVSLWKTEPWVETSTLAFMEPTRMSRVAPTSGDSILVRNLADYQTAITRVDADRYTTVTAPIAMDLLPLVDSIRLVASSTVGTRSNYQMVRPVPDDTVVSLGEISRGRWYALRYSDAEKGLCVDFRTADFGGPSTCVPDEPGNERCPLISAGGGENLPWRFTVIFPFDTGASVITVLQDIVPSDIQVEHNGGFTFASGASSETVMKFDVLIDGEPVCPQWAADS